MLVRTAGAGNPASLMVSACAVWKTTMFHCRASQLCIAPRTSTTPEPPNQINGACCPLVEIFVGDALLESGFWKRLPGYLPRMVVIVTASFALFRKPIRPPNTFLARQRKRTWTDRRDRPDFEKLTKNPVERPNWVSVQKQSANCACGVDPW